jgi:hypothetical protein
MITAEFVKNGKILKQVKDIKNFGCQSSTIEIFMWIQKET